MDLNARIAHLDTKLQVASEEYKSGRTNTRKAFERVARLARQKVALQLSEG